MAVTSGKDTGKNMGGGASGGPSGGGPGGGSLSAPNRTAPSSGAGGQRGSGGSGMRGAGSNTGPGSARPGSDTSSKATSSSSSSKSSTASKSTGPDRGPTSSPARTAPSSGITSGRSAAQQKSVDKAKQSYSQYGGAQTSMRNATVSKSAPSAKVTDPSRGITSPMSGQGASYSSPQKAAAANQSIAARRSLAKDVGRTLSNYSTPAASRMAQDPSIAGRLAEANKNYKTTSLGGNGSRTYSDPDVKPGSLGQSYTDSILGGIQKAVNSVSGAMSSPMPAAADPYFRGILENSNNLATRVSNVLGAAYNNSVDKVGGYVDNLMNQPVMGASRTVNGSIIGNQPTADSAAQVVAGDVISRMGPRAGTAPPSMPSNGVDIEREYQDPLGTLSAAPQRTRSIADAILQREAPRQPTKQIVDRLPQDIKRQKVVDDIKNQRNKGLTSAWDQRAPSAKVARDQQVAQGPAPEMSPEDILPAEPPVASVMPGNIFNKPVRSLIADVQAAAQKARGLGGNVKLSTPTQIDTPYGDPSVSPSQQGNYPANVSPSQQGNYPPDENPLQDAGQADDYGQLKNRFGYEKDRAVQGAKELPGKILDALIAGDFRKYNGTTNDKRDDIRQRRQMAQQALQGLSSSQQAALITQLMVLLQQTSLGGGNASQAALVNNTFPQG